jgi:hypothetical protein
VRFDTDDRGDIAVTLGNAQRPAVIVATIKSWWTGQRS